MHESEIDILLATYNGEAFLEQQLDSLFTQTFENFSLIVRDDCSIDSTLDILELYRSRFPDRVKVLINQTRQGACRNFSLLTQQSSAPYFAFCDQDDIWRPDKLEISLRAMKKTENRCGKGVPVLVFTDIALVDENAGPISPSMWRVMRVFPERLTFSSQLVQNLIPGCTSLGNRSLLKWGSPVPDDAMMHDYWFGLVAMAFGSACSLRDVTVKYRQHRNNAVGAQCGWHAGKLRQLWRDPHLKKYMEASQVQARVFANRYASVLSEEQKTTIEVWCGVHEQPLIVRQWKLYEHGLRRTGTLNNLGFMIRV